MGILLNAYIVDRLRKGSLVYVSDLPGEGGVDWGYTRDPAKAKAITPRQFTAFAKYQRGLGQKACSHIIGTEKAT